ncbi:MAG: hypothetical protein HGA85_00820 [Nanoarchaeota archaeon]|nr:hypothetical protein [Nanoarchaeota archaeon]
MSKIGDGLKALGQDYGSRFGKMLNDATENTFVYPVVRAGAESLYQKVMQAPPDAFGEGVCAASAKLTSQFLDDTVLTFMRTPGGFKDRAGAVGDVFKEYKAHPAGAAWEYFGEAFIYGVMDSLTPNKLNGESAAAYVTSVLVNHMKTAWTTEAYELIGLPLVTRLAAAAAKGEAESKQIQRPVYTKRP